MLYVGGGLLVLGLVGLLPLATIWALNTLFGLSIAFTLKTWAAALVLVLLLGSNSHRKG